jgi:hypothetical protein
MNGKGDKTRKKTVSQEVWDKNWQNIFGKKENKNGRGSGSKDNSKR